MEEFPCTNEILNPLTQDNSPDEADGSPVFDDTVDVLFGNSPLRYVGFDREVLPSLVEGPHPRTLKVKPIDQHSFRYIEQSQCKEAVSKNRKQLIPKFPCTNEILNPLTEDNSPDEADGSPVFDDTVDVLFGNSPLRYVGFDREEFPCTNEILNPLTEDNSPDEADGSPVFDDSVDVLFGNSPLRYVGFDREVLPSLVEGPHPRTLKVKPIDQHSFRYIEQSQRKEAVSKNRKQLNSKDNSPDEADGSPVFDDTVDVFFGNSPLRYVGFDREDEADGSPVFDDTVDVLFGNSPLRYVGFDREEFPCTNEILNPLTEDNSPDEADGSPVFDDTVDVLFGNSPLRYVGFDREGPHPRTLKVKPIDQHSFRYIEQSQRKEAVSKNRKQLIPKFPCTNEILNPLTQDNSPDEADGSPVFDDTVDVLFGNSPLRYVGFDREEFPCTNEILNPLTEDNSPDEADGSPVFDDTVDVLFGNSPLRYVGFDREVLPSLVEGPHPRTLKVKPIDQHSFRYIEQSQRKEAVSKNRKQLIPKFPCTNEILNPLTEDNSPDEADGSPVFDDTVDVFFGNSPLCYVGFDREDEADGSPVFDDTVDVLFGNSPLRYVGFDREVYYGKNHHYLSPVLPSLVEGPHPRTLKVKPIDQHSFRYIEQSQRKEAVSKNRKQLIPKFPCTNEILNPLTQDKSPDEADGSPVFDDTVDVLFGNSPLRYVGFDREEFPCTNEILNPLTEDNSPDEADGSPVFDDTVDVLFGNSPLRYVGFDREEGPHPRTLKVKPIDQHSFRYIEQSQRKEAVSKNRKQLIPKFPCTNEILNPLTQDKSPDEADGSPVFDDTVDVLFGNSPLRYVGFDREEFPCTNEILNPLTEDNSPDEADGSPVFDDTVDVLFGNSPLRYVGFDREEGPHPRTLKVKPIDQHSFRYIEQSQRKEAVSKNRKQLIPKFTCTNEILNPLTQDNSPDEADGSPVFDDTVDVLFGNSPLRYVGFDREDNSPDEADGSPVFDDTVDVLFGNSPLRYVGFDREEGPHPRTLKVKPIDQHSFRYIEQSQRKEAVSKNRKQLIAKFTCTNEILNPLTEDNSPDEADGSPVFDDTVDVFFGNSPLRYVGFDREDEADGSPVFDDTVDVLFGNSPLRYVGFDREGSVLFHVFSL
ncbi:hypothetical protein L1987_21005 [Smallanthus sonchifolius]|uniref:Uncharacterized protein n=1 Tax=Smallanthus sonchifolius TaxID=185202 RepID=A0ACB9ISN3_9ASTR|nr:hypothetical protein L1987_21005 [Smallanthus sonchifolius]